MQNKVLYLDTVIKQVSDSSGGLRIEGYANTVSKDRVGDVIVSKAWVDGITAYKTNPILLNQHNREQPIGRVDKLTVDSNGLLIEAFVSEAAEKLYGMKTLISDGVVRAFSVGFIPKEVQYDKKSDTKYITKLELYEISVVSIPANADSVFSVKKQLGENTECLDNITKQVPLYKVAIGGLSNEHYHTFEVDSEGNGVSTYSSNGLKHTHKVENFKVLEEDNHTHDISSWKDLVKFEDVEATVLFDNTVIPEQVVTKIDFEPVEKEAVTIADYIEPLTTDVDTIDSELKEYIVKEDNSPFINLLCPKTSLIKINDTIVLNNTKYLVTSIATAQYQKFELKEIDPPVDENDNVLILDANNISVINFEEDSWNIVNHSEQETAKEDIVKRFSNSANLNLGDLIKLTSEETVKNSEVYQEILTDTIHLKSTPASVWTQLDTTKASRICDIIEVLKNKDNQDLILSLYGYKPINKENKMTTQHVSDTVMTVRDGQIGEEQDTVVSSASVAQPEVAKLVAKTGEAILKHASGPDDAPESHEVVELKRQVKQMSSQIASMTTNKMLWEQNNRSTQFTEKELANAYFLAKAMDKADPFDTKLGSKIKAVTSVDAFLSNFSSTVYNEMEQELIIAPLFRRIPVDAKTFRIPVANEDTDGDVAQFQSGTYATGPYDTTNVPTTNQHSMSAVALTPHKFMATTHIAKDEEEDTVLPLVEFLRAAAMRRLARAIDKSLLRGSGALTGFTAAPTNTISAGSTYASVIKGVATLANAISGLQVDTGASTQASTTNIASARTKLGKYGLQTGSNLVYLTTIEGYNELVQTSDFRTVDKFGSQATYLTGSLGAIYGIPVRVTEFLDTKGASTNIVGLLMYTPGFIIGERRGIEVETEYKARTQVNAMYMSTRLDMKALTTETDAALSATYSYAVALRSA